ncbi:MAG TPA: carboxypeptidase regulatory-like domain-containing protein, partial [Mycobacteriales bacterium]|nr:carboxypeptidase regulatory-like domain-containing protein [Mycobacteriales bacterium]
MLAAIGLLVIPAAAQPADEPAGTTAKIEQSLASTLAAEGSADFYVEFREQADLGAAAEVADWGRRGQAVVDALRRTADASQSDVRKELTRAGTPYQAFWVANTILVRGGTGALATSLAAHGNVTRLRAPDTYALPKPTPGEAEQTVDAVEWGIARIRADQVWSTFGVRGEGITVANIDTGVDYDHPAVVGKYRGNTGGGAFDHNYNWFDPSRVCGNPSVAPCDNNNHGTHTMGTMLGDDGAANQIGVAPGARWIAAKGCESNSCSDAALLASGQWILAPTDLAGANPRADLRPHVVNNSWGGGGGDAWYLATVNAWRAAGIFPAFSNGNSGPGCNTSGSPGDYAESYSSGAFDVNGAIASFSSRGAASGRVKPNLAAPGVNVRSSVNGGGYAAFNGTSMASPHTAGTVALMWSAAPSLVGDLAGTAALLNQTAIDTSDLTCGGTADNNNVWGQGKLDAFAAVEQSPRGPVGTLRGTVTSGGNPLAGARVTIDGPVDRTANTGADGTFQFTLPTGSYTVSVSAFGYEAATATVSVTEGETTTQDFALTAAPSGTLSGTVTSAAGPVANATVTVTGTPIAPVTTDASGHYSIANVPNGTYPVTVTAGGCFGPASRSVTVDGATTADFTLPQRADNGYGYTCVIESTGYVEGDTSLPLTGDDAARNVPLPFPFFFYGQTYDSAYVATNGHLNFRASSTTFSNVAIPATGLPNAAIYPLWDDLNVVSGTGSMWTKTTGTAPNRSFVIEWRNVNFYSTTLTVDFEAQLNEDGTVVTRYRNIGTDPREQGNSATVGIENATGTVGLQYSYNTAALSDGQSVKFRPPPTGRVGGTVTDANDGLPLAGATVRALDGTTVVSTATTGADGRYDLRLRLGTYTIEIARTHYVTSTGSVTLGEDGQVVGRDVALATARAEVSATELDFLGNEGQLRSAPVTLSNTSTSGVTLTYSIADDASWLWVVPASGTVAPGAARTLTVRADPSGLAPGVHEGTVQITTNAGRQPVVEIPVTLVVPAYRQGVNAGGGAYTDGAADPWAADRPYTPGGYGYVGTGAERSTTRGIAGTTDDALYQTQREGTGGYRFDALPAGTYAVDLDFAELRAGLPAGRRVFDVTVNGAVVLDDY